MFPQAAAVHGSLAIVYICLGVVNINDVFTLSSFSAHVEMVNHDKDTTTDIANCMNSHAEICLVFVLLAFLCFLPPHHMQK